MKLEKRHLVYWSFLKFFLFGFGLFSPDWFHTYCPITKAKKTSEITFLTNSSLVEFMGLFTFPAIVSCHSYLLRYQDEIMRKAQKIGHKSQRIKRAVYIVIYYKILQKDDFI